MRFEWFLPGFSLVHNRVSVEVLSQWEASLETLLRDKGIDHK